MNEINIYKLLMPLDDLNYYNFNTFEAGKALLIFGNSFSEAELEIYFTPFRLSRNFGNKLCLNCFRDSKKNIRWYIRKYQERSKDLSGSFSEGLIIDKINDEKSNIYEVISSHTFGTISVYSDFKRDKFYFLQSTESEDNLKDVFYFSARKLTEMLNSGGFCRIELKKLANFLYENFTKMKHGQE